jgi:signal transduction histidine kinase
MKLNPVAKALSAETEYNFLRIAQEAITNALKHSGASAVDVALESTADEVRLIVHDDGCGFADRDANNNCADRFGLLGMRERARQIGAHFDLETSSGRGTTVRVALPITASLAELPT